MKNSKSSPNKHYAKLLADSSNLRDAVEDAQLSIDISMQIASLRQRKKYTQKQLAELANIQQSNISRLENPGYQGYTLKVLSKVVRALGAKLRIEILTPTITITTRHEFLSEARNISSLTSTDMSATKWPAEYREVVFSSRFKERINV